MLYLIIFIMYRKDFSCNSILCNFISNIQEISGNNCDVEKLRKFLKEVRLCDDI